MMGFWIWLAEMLVICVDWGGLQHNFNVLVAKDVGFVCTMPAPEWYKYGSLIFIFKLMPIQEQCKNHVEISLDVENTKCSICLNVWHDVVTVSPCLHNFCNGCFSEWLRRSQKQQKGVLCPQCRAAVHSVGRNHFLHNIEECQRQSREVYCCGSMCRTNEDVATNEMAYVNWSQLLETLPLPNIKWICPTAPTLPVAVFGGFPSTAWFDVGDLSEDGPEDLEGLDTSAAHVANLLSTEPADIKLGVGGFSMGAATALYSATCCTHGKYSNGNAYPVNLSAVVGLSGWLPSSRSLKSKIEETQEAARRAESLPLLLCHGKGDDVVIYKHGEKSAEVLTSTGFKNLAFKTYSGLGHYTVPEEMDDVCKWLTSKLELDGSSS